MSDTITKRLQAIYTTLFKVFGPQQWWPGDTDFEVMVGAVLTQNTAWSNVEKAIANLKRERLLTPRRLRAVPAKRLAALIRPSGYYNVKARRLSHLLAFIDHEYGGSLKRMFRDDAQTLRNKLLAVHGIGPETADSILLYAARKPLFVIDAYTKRIFSRHGLLAEHADYDAAQLLFMKRLPPDVQLYNEYHALIVRVGKEYCKKSVPRCSLCPLRVFLAG